MNAWNNLDKTEYSQAPTDDLVSCWRSKVKVAAGHRGTECIHIDAGMSEYI